MFYNNFDKFKATVKIFGR